MNILVMASTPAVRGEISQALSADGYDLALISDGNEVGSVFGTRIDVCAAKNGKRYGLEKARNILSIHYLEPLVRSLNFLMSDFQEFMGQDNFF